jgi:hypothetical protein
MAHMRIASFCASSARAITDAGSEELSDRWQGALLRQWAKEDWQSPREET